MRHSSGTERTQYDPALADPEVRARNIAERHDVITIFVSVTVATLLFAPHLLELEPPDRWWLLAAVCSIYLSIIWWLQGRFRGLLNQAARIDCNNKLTKE